MLNISQIPTIESTQVAVIGGGLAGIASAISSARTGAKTILIERNGFLGGVATAGLCCSLFNCCFSDSGEQKIFGPVMDIIECLAKEAGPGDSWKKHRGHMIFDIEKAKLALLKLLYKEGVIVRLFTSISATNIENNHVQGIYVTSRNGLEYIQTEVVVDCTGDSDVANLCGCPYKQSECRASYLFRLGNVNVDKFVDYFRQNPDEYKDYLDVDWNVQDAIHQYEENGTFLFPHGGGLFLSEFNKGIESGELHIEYGSQSALNATQMHCIRDTGNVHIITGFTTIPNLDSKLITEKVCEGKSMVFYMADFMKKHLPGFENSYVSMTADDMGIRLSRVTIPKAKLDFTPDNELREMPQDTLGKCLIINHFKGSDSQNWSCQKLTNTCFYVRLSNLLPQTGPDNLIMGSGRSINGRVRVMVNTMVVGQGAGISAGITAINKQNFNTIHFDLIQKELLKQNTI